MKRFLIVEKDKGLFLGSLEKMHLFARDNIFPVQKVPSFSTENEAMSYIVYMFGDKDENQYGVIEVDFSHRYVPIVEVIKQGYSEHTHRLIDYLPMISEEIH